MQPHRGSSCIVRDYREDIFGTLDKEEMEFLNEHSAIVHYNKGDMLLKQGAYLSHVIFLESGLVKVYLEGKAKDLILRIIPGGHFANLPPVNVESVLSTYSVSAYDESTVKLIELNAYKELIHRNPGFAGMVINILKEDEAQLQHRFYCLMRKQAHGRVADVLLCLSEQVYKSREIRLNLSRNDLADLTGLSAESLIRILKEFKEDGIILLRAKNLKILDYQALERISNTS